MDWKMDSAVVKYAQELIAHPSASRQSNSAIADNVETTLRQLGFDIERVEYQNPPGIAKVNVVGKLGTGTGGVILAAHTDTVPADDWADGDPCSPVVRDNRLYGRGSTDMKGPLACMLAAAEKFKSVAAPLTIICTADEEVGSVGARHVCKRSQILRDLKPVGGIIGEPTMLEVVHAHKGVALMEIVSRGIAAHSSTSVGVNANIRMIPFLAEMKELHDRLQTDPAIRNIEFDPPTPGWNIGINDHTPAVNVTPPQSICTIYYRPMPGDDVAGVMKQVEAAAKRHGLEYRIIRNGAPMYCDPQSPWVTKILEIAGRKKAFTAPYGTDGVMFGQHFPVVVCGPGDIAQAHTVDEWIALEQLNLGVDFYTRVIQQFCT